MDWLVEKSILFGVDKPTNAQLGLPDIKADDAFAKNLLTIIFGVAAAVAVLVIIIGALNIVKSNGDPEAIARGKKAVIYALVGLTVAVSAEIIVAFVLGRL